jgi:hypothetical protein
VLIYVARNLVHLLFELRLVDLRLVPSDLAERGVKCGLGFVGAKFSGGLLKGPELCPVLWGNRFFAVIEAPPGYNYGDNSVTDTMVSI